ncbi:MAG: hypothetical protein K0Q66_688 [Chitinophagaceae bacterium]|jgi:hypothetical protein|nr:hypothetical protein [Chitinophagaceae bacterium]
MRFIVLLLGVMIAANGIGQDSLFLKVHFLYGSKPKKEHRATESRWFGGVLGGHVGIELDSNRILNFVPSGKFHIITKNKKPHSRFAVHSFESFYSILGGVPGDNKKTIIYVPITAEQRMLFDSISKAYQEQTPYDYAFIGMRCGAAAYDILGKLGVLRAFSYGKTYRKIFYPKKLRKRLLKKAESNNWRVVREAGTDRRRWERD